MNAAGSTLTLLLSLIVFFLPRRWAALGDMAGICYITQGQQYIVAGFHMHAIRIVLLAGFIRLVVRGEFRNLKLNSIDRALFACTGAVTIIPWLREGSSSEL